MNTISAPMKTMAAAAMSVIFLPIIAQDAGASEIYGTGFEPATFALGPIDGQDGWFGPPKVQNGVAESGTQALVIGGLDGASRPMNSAVGSDLFSLQADYRRSGEAGESGIFISVDAATSIVASLFETPSGFVLRNKGGDSTAPQPFKSETWHQLIIELDFLADTLSGFVDGQPLGTLTIKNLPEPTTITRIGLYSLGVGKKAQAIYFDDVVFSTTTIPAVPEASTMLMLPGLGGLLMLGAWRRRSSRVSRCA